MAVQGKTKTPSTATVKKASTTKKVKPVVEEVITPVATVEEVVEQVVDTPVIEKIVEQVVEAPVEIKKEKKSGNPEKCGACTKKYGSMFCGSCVTFVSKK